MTDHRSPPPTPHRPHLSAIRVAAAAVAAAGLAAGLPPPAEAGEFLDTRITFLFTDDDVLHAAGETTPSSPGASFGVRRGRIFFFENHNRKDRGDETLTHLVAHRAMAGYLPGLTTEAALVLRFNLLTETNPVQPGLGQAELRDDGTYINLIYDLGGMDVRTGKGRDVTLTLFPYDTERFQLGYSYRMAWGGSRIFGKERRGPAPGAKLNFDWDESYAFVGAKTAQIQRYAVEDDPRQNDEVDSFYAGLLGAGVELGSLLFPHGGNTGVLLEVNGGYFQRGTNPRPGVRGRAVDAAGVSFQVTFHHGLPVRRSADFSLYRQDTLRAAAPDTPAASPENAGRPAPPPPETTSSPTGILVAAEGTYLAQSLEDPERYGGLSIQAARAGDVNLVWGAGRGVTVFADLIYRDLAFVLFNQPSFVPYQDFATGTEVRPEVWAGVGADWTIGDTHVTPGVTVGVQRPASVTAIPEAGVNAPEGLRGRHTVVVREEGLLSILPPDREVVPIWAAKVRVRWDLSPAVALLAEAFASVDDNRTRLEDDPAGIAVRTFEDPYLLGFGLVAQARF